jgi:hypothetical protein
MGWYGFGSNNLTDKLESICTNHNWYISYWNYRHIYKRLPRLELISSEESNCICLWWRNYYSKRTNACKNVSCWINRCYYSKLKSRNPWFIWITSGQYCWSRMQCNWLQVIYRCYKFDTCRIPSNRKWPYSFVKNSNLGLKLTNTSRNSNFSICNYPCQSIPTWLWIIIFNIKYSHNFCLQQRSHKSQDSWNIVYNICSGFHCNKKLLHNVPESLYILTC